MTLRDLLFFATGLKDIPPVGFQTGPTLRFMHDDGSRYPKAHTCSCDLLIPVCHTNFDEFLRDMDFGITSGHGFGYA